MIYCVWYPSGGFGHFVNAVLTLHGKNFQQSIDTDASPSKNGNFHTFKLAVPTYFHDPEMYQFEFDQSKNYSVLIDNGINNETEVFRNTFPDSQTIKMCYSDFSWPVVAKTMIVKAQQLDFEKAIRPEDTNWKSNDDWAIREKYFLYLKDHYLRDKWRPNNISHNIFVEDLLDYNNIVNTVNSAGIVLDNFEELYQQWQKYNLCYFQPIVIAKEFINGTTLDTPITDIWTQAVVYYQIWCRYGVEVPHNDFANFFQDQQQFQQWLKDKI